jgi:hypothetical protein
MRLRPVSRKTMNIMRIKTELISTVTVIKQLKKDYA